MLKIINFFNICRIKYPHFFLLAPGTLLIIIFFLLPLSMMFAISFYEHIPGKYMKPAFNPGNYINFLTDSFYLSKVLYLSLELGIISSVLAVVLGYPLAYFLARGKRKQRKYLLTLIIAPLWVNVVIRVLGWMIILMDNGILNNTLKAIGLIDSPIKFMYSKTGVLIALTQISIPYVVLSLTGVIQAIDPVLEEAAENLGANKIQTFLKVTLPLSMPGVVAGSLLVFALNISSFVIPGLMGGGRVRMIAVMAYEQTMMLGNFPFGAAMGFILLGVTLISITFYIAIINKISKREVT